MINTSIITDLLAFFHSTSGKLDEVERTGGTNELRVIQEDLAAQNKHLVDQWEHVRLEFDRVNQKRDDIQRRSQEITECVQLLAEERGFTRDEVVRLTHEMEGQQAEPTLHLMHVYLAIMQCVLEYQGLNEQILADMKVGFAAVVEMSEEVVKMEAESQALDEYRAGTQVVGKCCQDLLERLPGVEAAIRERAGTES